ncbi:hypothetical protein ACLOJK_022876 [Asimina triloba]
MVGCGRRCRGDRLALDRCWCLDGSLGQVRLGADVVRSRWVSHRCCSIMADAGLGLRLDTVVGADHHPIKVGHALLLDAWTDFAKGAAVSYWVLPRLILLAIIVGFFSLRSPASVMNGGRLTAGPPVDAGWKGGA